MRRLLAAMAIVALVSGATFGMPTMRAQTPAPGAPSQPGPAPTVTPCPMVNGCPTPAPVAPVTATVAPGVNATLTNPTSGLAVTLVNESDLTVVAALGSALRVTVPAGRFLEAVESTALSRVRCADDPRSADACFSINMGTARLVFRIGVATTPPPTPVPPLTVRIGETAAIAPGQAIVFSRPSVRLQLSIPGATYGIRVVNESDQTVSGNDDGRVIALMLPAGRTIRAEVVNAGSPTAGIASRLCPTEPRSPNVALCAGFFEGRGVSLEVRVGAAGTPPANEDVALAAGCTNVTLTWPEQTPADLVARAVAPAGALEAIWWYWPSAGRFVSYSPGASEEANDYTVTVTSLETVFVCMRSRGTLTRPAR